MWTIYRHINKINGKSYIGKAEECGYPRSSGSKNWDGNTRIEENFCKISLEIDRLTVGECKNGLF